MHRSDDQQHVPPDVVERDDGLSGFVILRLSRQLGPGDGPDLRQHAQDLGLSSLDEYLRELGPPPTRRAITSVEPSELLSLEEQAMNSALPPLNSLTRYWRIDARRLQQPLKEIVQRLSRLDGVELAYLETVVSAAGTVTRRLAETAARRLPGAVIRLLPGSKQRYLNAAPTGIDARWAWKQPGGQGQGVEFTDLEPGWRLTHEALVNTATVIPIPPVGPPRLINEAGIGVFIGHHGTHVLGMIGPNANRQGLIGLTPALRSLHAAPIFDPMTGAHEVADAVTAAWTTMRVGDVLLLEVQRHDPNGALPTETDRFDFDAIRLATAHGRTVVEPAANGTRDLNQWQDPNDGRRLDSGHPDWDSGAVMVGACQVSPDGKISYQRTATSNHGKRVNCFAWGDWVATCGGDDAAPDTSYTDRFNGTSSAAAIIAGAAVLTQSMNLAMRPGQPLWPRWMRSILANPNTGTPYKKKSPYGIGSMPNLKLIKTHVLDNIP